MRKKYASAIETEKYKIIFQFSLMLVASVIGGIFFSKLLSCDVTDKVVTEIAEHFNMTFNGKDVISDIIKQYIKFCIPDIICIALILVFSFSFINYIVLDCIIVYLGFKYGLNSAIVKSAAFSYIGFGNSLAYWFLRAAVLVLIVFFSCKMSFYSLSNRSFTSNGRFVMSKKILIAEAIDTLTTFGLLFLINGIYFVFVCAF